MASYWRGAKKLKKKDPAYHEYQFFRRRQGKHQHVCKLAYLKANPEDRQEMMGVVRFEVTYLCNNSLCINQGYFSREPMQKIIAGKISKTVGNIKVMKNVQIALCDSNDESFVEIRTVACYTLKTSG